jgi:hypothetical protein
MIGKVMDHGLSFTGNHASIRFRRLIKKYVVPSIWSQLLSGVTKDGIFLGLEKRNSHAGASLSWDN